MLRRIDLAVTSYPTSSRAGWKGLRLGMPESQAIRYLEGRGFARLRLNRLTWTVLTERLRYVPNSHTQVDCCHPRAFDGEPVWITVISLDARVCVLTVEVEASDLSDFDAIRTALCARYGTPVEREGFIGGATWWHHQGGDFVNLSEGGDRDPESLCTIRFFDEPRWQLAQELVDRAEQIAVGKRAARYSFDD